MREIAPIIKRYNLGSSGCFRFFKIQRSGINAVPKAGRLRTVFKNMAEVCIAFTAKSLDSTHKKRGIFFSGD